mgnify:CR=1 FL=1
MGIDDKIGCCEENNPAGCTETLSEIYNKRRKNMTEMLYSGESNRNLALSCMLMYNLVSR